MRRIRVTGRFYVFLAMLAVGLFFIIREFIPFDASEAVVSTGTDSYSMTMDAVIVRDESVTSYEGSNGRVIYLAQEGAEVEQGEDIVELYTAAYAVEAFNELDKVRQNIRVYQQTILGNIIDTNLERLESNVQAQALELKRLVANKSVGSLTNVEKMLEQTMQERQNYLNSNRRDDRKLTTLYGQEASKQNAISSWKSIKKADKAGVVSFYLDGYETQLTPGNLQDITSADIKNVLQKKPLAAQTANARLRQNIFKVVSTDKWYVLLYTSNTGWNPIKGQTFQMQMEGVNGFAFVGSVESLQKGSDGVLARVEVQTPLGPMLNRRSGKVNIGVNLTGFTVAVNAIATKDGETGVYVTSPAGVVFVPVVVLSSDSRYALIEPTVEGTLEKGSRVVLQ